MSDVARDAIHDGGTPSAFFREHESRLSASAEVGPTLDLACGRGRHARAASDLGLSVVAIDRNPAFLHGLAEFQRRQQTAGSGRIDTLHADLESPSLLPSLEPASFGAVLVFRYLHRPLFAWIEALVAPGGCILYETFTEDQRELGWGPRRDAHLLKSGELPKLFSELVIEIYEEGPSNDQPSAHTARVLASRPILNLAYDG